MVIWVFLFFFLRLALKHHVEPIPVLTDFFAFASALQGDGFMIYSSSECSSWVHCPSSTAVDIDSGYQRDFNR